MTATNLGRRPTEFWTLTAFSRPENMAAFANRIEADGWHGLSVHDSQNLWGDPFVYMTLAALATKELKFTIATSNPVTRHPAVSASAIASVHAIAPGRVTMGIGRGDSAIAYIGGSPSNLRHFRSYLQSLRKYLNKQEVDTADIAEWLANSNGADAAADQMPVGSRLQWLTEDDSVVPIEVMATGPKTIGIGAQYADAICFGLGADVERLKWGVAVAKEKFAGRKDIPRLKIGAAVSVAVCEDRAQGRAMLANLVAASARWSAMHGKLVGPAEKKKAEMFELIAKNYEMTRHGDTGKQTNVLSDEFLDNFAIIGPIEHCVERLEELIAVGLDKISIAPPVGDFGDAGKRAYSDLINKVIPKVRRS